VPRRWQKIDRFLAIYKLVYMVGLGCNLFIIAAYERTAAPLDLAIGIAALVLNLGSALAYLRGRYVGFIAERALSLGRMIVPLAVATIILSEPVIALSPLSVVLWMGIVRIWLVHGNRVLWLMRAILLGLEVGYFRRLRSDYAARSTPSLSPS
jgi:hypothetical protein